MNFRDKYPTGAEFIDLANEKANNLNKFEMEIGNIVGKNPEWVKISKHIQDPHLGLDSSHISLLEYSKERMKIRRHKERYPIDHKIELYRELIENLRNRKVAGAERKEILEFALDEIKNHEDRLDWSSTINKDIRDVEEAFRVDPFLITLVGEGDDGKWKEEVEKAIYRMMKSADQETETTPEMYNLLTPAMADFHDLQLMALKYFLKGDKSKLSKLDKNARKFFLANMRNIKACGKDVKEVIKYWTSKVRNAPREHYEIMEPLKFSYDQNTTEWFEKLIKRSAFSFLESGGFEYREALADLACPDGCEIAIDLGSGDGFMLPALLSRSKRVWAMDLYLKGLPDTRKFLNKNGKGVVEMYGGVDYPLYPLTEGYPSWEKKIPDVAVISSGEFLPVEDTARNCARRKIKRVVVGTAPTRSPIKQYDNRNETLEIPAHEQKYSSYEPLRWAKELGRHYRNISIYSYNGGRFVIKADNLRWLHFY